MKIEIYTLDYCPFCKKALAFLDDKKVEYKRIRIDEDENAWFEKLAKAFDIKNDVTVPQIIVDGKRIGGYSDMLALHDEGKFLN